MSIMGAGQRSSLREWLANGPSATTGLIACIGDVMLDRFVYGQVSRISPEAPVPVFHELRHFEMLGGAGNVVRNLVSLGGRSVFVTAVGDDPEGDRVVSLASGLKSASLQISRESGRASTLKTRYVCGTQQILRIDREVCSAFSDSVATRTMVLAADALANAQIGVLSDYGKGLLRAEDTQRLIRIARANRCPIIIDPKGDCYERYRRADLLTPNRVELSRAAQMPARRLAEVENAARQIIARYELGGVATTLGDEGILLVIPGAEPIHLPATAREVFDVAGAGDTVVAGIAVGLAAKLPLDVAVAFGNEAAGLAVSRKGTCTVTFEEVRRHVTSDTASPDAAKIVTLQDMEYQLAAWRQCGLRIGFTNGCFDVLHVGHVSLLRCAKSHCDRLIVAVNSDASVRELKGAGRPINAQEARVEVLAGLRDTDAVIVFDEATPLSLIRTIRPDVIVKGSDYTESEVVGAEFVAAYGGTVRLAPYLAGHSTTRITSRREELTESCGQ